MSIIETEELAPYVGIATFLRSRMVTADMDLDKIKFDIGVMGVPFDVGVIYDPGSRFAPRAIREQSLRIDNRRGVYSYDKKKTYLAEELARKSILDFGDVNIIPCEPKENVDRTTKLAREIVNRDALLIAMGGDHSVTWPLVRAFEGKPLHVIQFDAHPDYVPIAPPAQYTNGHPISQIARMDHVKSITQVGIRSIRDADGVLSEADGNKIVSMGEFRKLGAQGIANLLPEGEDVYITIDIDAYDISLIPGCGSPEPDGFQYAELRDTLAAVAARSRVVGFDLVEVSPLLDLRNNATSYLGMLTMVELLGQICEQPYWKARYEKNNQFLSVDFI